MAETQPSTAAMLTVSRRGALTGQVRRAAQAPNSEPMFMIMVNASESDSE